MVTGDGLLLRLRPSLHRLEIEQVEALAELANRYGNGNITLTNRGGIQLRGVQERDFAALKAACGNRGLLGPGDEGPAVITTPEWVEGDFSSRVGRQLELRSQELGPLPGKFCFLVDAGPQRLLSETRADLRIERGQNGGLIVRADGCEMGQSVDESTLWAAISEWTCWFQARRSDDARRLRHVLADHAPPFKWQGVPPVAKASSPGPGPGPQGPLLSAPFGEFRAADLCDVLSRSGARALRATPFRSVLLEGGKQVHHARLISRNDDPRLGANACPGAPACPQATLPTRPLALAILARRAELNSVPLSVHVSGCGKGCALQGPADLVCVARDGKFDLLLNASASGSPYRSNVSFEEALAACAPTLGPTNDL